MNSITKTAFFHLRIAQLNLFNSVKEGETVIHAFVSSLLDYCNALFIGLPASSITRLLYTQNSAARILIHTKHSAHITPFLFELHWLQVQILLLSFKTLHGLAPYYLCNLLHYYILSRSLCSSEFGLLFVLKYCLSSMWGRSFRVVAPKLWNFLPLYSVALIVFLNSNRNSKPICFFNVIILKLCSVFYCA